MNSAAHLYIQFAGRFRHDLGNQSSFPTLQFHAYFRSTFKQAEHGAAQQVAGTDGFRVPFEEDDVLGGKLEQATDGVPVAFGQKP